LFALRFNVVGSGGQFSTVSFTNTPTIQEFVDVNFNTIVNYVLNPGRVDILQSATLSGRIKSETGSGIRSVTIASQGPINATQTTGINGNYSQIVQAASSYVITPSKTNDTIAANGVTTLDILLIQRHIQGTQLLSSPYKIIAADVNNSSTVTSLDVNLINSLILGNIRRFPNNRLWAFVPHDHVFTNPRNPFPFPSSRSYTSTSNQSNQDFIGMRLGDVNNSYNPSIARIDAADSLYFIIPDLNVNEGDTALVPLMVKGFDRISGFQMALLWDSTALEYIGIDDQAALSVNAGTANATGGELIINWYDAGGASQTFPDSSVLCSFRFKTLTGPGSETSISVASTAALPLEAYDDSLNVLSVSASSGTRRIVSSTGFPGLLSDVLVIKARPNPFAGKTDLVVSGPYEGELKLELFDALGRRVKDISFGYTGAPQTVEIGNEVASGVYLLKILDAENRLLSSLKLLKSR
jgi:hypothetical protein